MSPIGRIFIVLNLILSAAFLGWAANALATTENYKQTLKDERATWETDRAAKDDEVSQLNSQKDRLENDARSFREQRDQVQAGADDVQTQLDEAKRQNAQMQTQLAAIQASLGDFNDTLAQLTQQKDDAVERAREAARERDDAQAAAQAAELARRDAVEASQTAELRIGDLEATRASLQEELAASEMHLAMLVQVTGVNIDAIQVQPQIEAAVLDVRLDLAPGLVMLNVGRNKEVQRGFTFEIYRGGQYKGQVRVENVQANVSSAIITRSVDGTTIAQGDRAATHL